MNKLLKILKDILGVYKLTLNKETTYYLTTGNAQLTEEEYNLIKEFLEKEENENGN